MNCEKCGTPIGAGAIALTCHRCSNLNRAQSTASEPAIKVGDWVENGGRGYQVVRLTDGGDTVWVDGQTWVHASDCLPIPTRPEPRDGWEPSGEITSKPCAEWFSLSGSVHHIMEDGISVHGTFGPRRWKAVRSKVEPVPEAPKHLRSSAYPHACAVLARESERLLHSMRITLETPTEVMVRQANERYAALEMARAEQALLYADDRLGALIELVKAARANVGGGNDDRAVWLRRAIAEAEALT